MTKKPIKTIKAKLPEGFKLIVSETTLPKNILVLKNKKGQKLFIRIANPKELLKPKPQWIFEILSLEDMQKHGLKIEETYNHELAKKGLYVEESSSEGEDDDDFEKDLPPEALEAIKKRKQKQSQVTINISGQKGKEGETEEDSLSEGFKDILRLKCEENDIPYVEPKSLVAYRKLLRQVQSKEEQIEAENKANPKGQSGTAVLPDAFTRNKPVANPEELKEQLLSMEFENAHEMIDTLHEVERMGTSQEKKVARGLLDKLLMKSMQIRQNPQFRGFKMTGEKSAKQVLEELNDEIRQKRRMKRGETD